MQHDVTYSKTTVLVPHRKTCTGFLINTWKGKEIIAANLARKKILSF